MKRKVESWTVQRLYEQRTLISFPEYQRQPKLWPTDKKVLLIDSILKGIDIPKLYFNQTKDRAYEVIDGQQRLWAIWEFLDGIYPYKEKEVRTTFSDLDTAQKNTILKYELQVTVFQDADESYLRETFVRLQLGLLLLTGEKLHALSGAMKDFVFDKLAKHQFIQNLERIPEKRYARATLCAQICINSFTLRKLGEFARTRWEDLDYFFKEYQQPKGTDLEFFQKMKKHVSAVLDQINACFGDRAKELKNRSYILSTFLFFEDLYSNGKLDSEKSKKEFVIFSFKLWERLKQEAKAGIKRKNEELYLFETFLSSAPGEKYQIERRHQKLKEYYEHFRRTTKILGDK